MKIRKVYFILQKLCYNEKENASATFRVMVNKSGGVMDMSISGVGSNYYSQIASGSKLQSAADGSRVRSDRLTAMTWVPGMRRMGKVC